MCDILFYKGSDYMGFFKHPNLIYPTDKKERTIGSYVVQGVSIFGITVIVLALIYFSMKGVG